MEFSTLPQWPAKSAEGGEEPIPPADRGSWIAATVIGVITVLGLGWLVYELVQFIKEVGGNILMPPG
jgi:hypothetical protein